MNEEKKNNSLKEEVETESIKAHVLTDDELKQVTGGYLRNDPRNIDSELEI